MIRLLRLVQNDIHIIPPLFTAEIRVGPAFDAHRSAVRVMDHLHISVKRLLVFSVLPEKGQHMVFRLAGHQFLNSQPHRIPPSALYLYFIKNFASFLVKFLLF